MRENKARTSSSGKHLFMLGVGILTVLGMLTGCGSNSNTRYEGGNISVSYDKDKWELTCCSAEEYPVFALTAGESDIWFAAVKNDGGLADGYHDALVDMYEMVCDVEEVESDDRWEEKSVLCYIDRLTDEEEDGYSVTYAKAQDEGWLILATAAYPVDESGGTNEEEKDEILQILDSLSQSDKTEIGELEENDDIQFFAQIIMSLMRYETTAADDGEDTDEEGAKTVQDGGGTGELISDEDAAALRAVEKFMIEDYFAEKGQQCPVYGPKGSDYEDGFLFYYDHGIMYSATAYEDGGMLFMYQLLDDMIASQEEEWENDESFSDIQAGELMSNGDDRYIFLSTRGEDFYGTPYDEKKIYYLDMQENDIGVIWILEIREPDLDEESELIIEEIAQCYGISLDDLAVDGEWTQKDQQRRVDEQDVYEPEEGELVLTEVDGYRYMGMATLSIGDDGLECPAMALMGRSTTVKEESITSSMHGVSVYVHGHKMIAKDFLNDMKMTYKSAARGLEDSEYEKNGKMSDIMRMEGYDEAAYFVMDYDRYNSTGEYTCHEARIDCYIRLDADYMLYCCIRLKDNEFDTATSAVVQELEKAYGVDLSKYYKE